MELQQGIIDTAAALGIDPLDLATAISYETGGTFDPTKAGPTTKWGQHRGLIQFGEPQAQQYGVDWSNPVASQLGPNGAVANYLRDTGVQPGMGLLDIYSAINAGGIGRYGASDAAAGGAPGTVRDKVENQMAGHRANAERILGNVTMSSKSTPERMEEAVSRSSGLLGGLIGEDRRDALIMGLAGLSMNPNQALIQGASQRIQDRRAETQTTQQRNVTADWLESRGYPDLANGVRSGAIPAAAALQQAMAAPKGPEYKVVGDALVQIRPDGTVSEAYAQPQSAGYTQVRGSELGLQGDDAGRLFNVGPDGKITSIGGGGTSVTVNNAAETSRYGEAPTGTVWALDGSGQHIMETVNGLQRPVTIPLSGTEAEKRAADIRSGGQLNQAAAARADDSLRLIESVMNDPALGQVTGMVQGRIPPLTQSGTDLVAKIEHLQGQTFLQAFETLKGGGQITEREGQAAQNAMARLQRSQSLEAYQESLKELYDIMERGKQRAMGQDVPEYGGGSDLGGGFSVTGVIN